MKAWTAIAVKDIPLNNSTIKKGQQITVTNSKTSDYTLWHGTGLYEISKNYIKIKEIISKD